MSTPKTTGLKEQFSALKNIPPLFKLIWKTNKTMMSLNVGLRILKSAIPLAQLYIAKILLDEVVQLIQKQHANTDVLWRIVGFALGLSLFSELINRAISLTDSLLGDLFSNQTSVEIIQKASTLDLYQFEDPIFYDKLDRARRQTTGRTVLMSLVF